MLRCDSARIRTRVTAAFGNTTRLWPSTWPPPAPTAWQAAAIRRWAYVSTRPSQASASTRYSLLGNRILQGRMAVYRRPPLERSDAPTGARGAASGALGEAAGGRLAVQA